MFTYRRGQIYISALTRCARTTNPFIHLIYGNHNWVTQAVEMVQGSDMGWWRRAVEIVQGSDISYCKFGGAGRLEFCRHDALGRIDILDFNLFDVR